MSRPTAKSSDFLRPPNQIQDFEAADLEWRMGSRGPSPFLRFVVWSAVDPMMGSAVDPMGGARTRRRKAVGAPPIGSTADPIGSTADQTTKRRNGRPRGSVTEINGRSVGWSVAASRYARFYSNPVPFGHNK